jgi:lysophospholipase L1-like esterase
MDDDYIVDADSGRIRRPPGSRMPILSPDAMATVDPDLLHSRLVTVDYTTDCREWRDAAPPDKSDLLPNTHAAIAEGEPLTICVMGDSISEGYDATGFRDVPPRQPPYVELVAHGLARQRRAPVQMRNHAVAGWTTEHAEWQIPEVAACAPTLVIIAFGMNDACYAEPPAFGERVAAMTRQLSAHSTQVEFALVTPMLPTEACTWVDASRFEGYRTALLSLERRSLAVADVTQVWRALLERKHPLELSGNGTNHPNDFGHRVYAQTILATLGRVQPRLE